MSEAFVDEKEFCSSWSESSRPAGWRTQQPIRIPKIAFTLIERKTEGPAGGSRSVFLRTIPFLFITLPRH